ncbi:hypothetical protein KZ829_02120 [Actinoplanes hulinensis]|uniref:Uncharacterized protein n=1 Tax=Actinoplanes hulinensis TaxID=1144547 RepID=A0ABS7AUT2_9ACTN|nr:hypothetical protein [Actinoplanes hulinensis]MBW6432538.1 hypothetical protein [Actinoplanes hulinensis]
MIQARITDRAVLAARSPSELAMYLRAKAWAIRERDRGGIIWVKVIGSDEFEVLQPHDSALRDYPSRVRDLLSVLASAEDRSELDVLADITDVSMDVHSIRTFPADHGPGLIGLDDGVQAYESLRSLVVAAAYAVSSEQPRAVQPARKPAEVLRFLREVAIGAPVEGSFVLSVHTPIPPRLSGQPSLFDDDVSDALEPAEPFERRVSLKLYDAVRAANDAANDALISSNGLDAFTDAVPRGISANLCEALVGLGGEAGHPFELTMRLAIARPLRARALLEPIRFRRDHLPVLASAAQELRERVADEGVLIVGNVVRLHREGVGSGEISVAGTIEGEDRLRRVWMPLGDGDYTQATRAHQEMRSVTVRGDLVRRGTRLYLTNPSAFQVVADRDE